MYPLFCFPDFPAKFFAIFKSDLQTICCPICSAYRTAVWSTIERTDFYSEWNTFRRPIIYSNEQAVRVSICQSY